MRIEIDEDKCIASGQCVLTAPGVFDQRDHDGVVVLLDESPTDERTQTAAREAASLCPAALISIHE